MAVVVVAVALMVASLVVLLTAVGLAVAAMLVVVAMLLGVVTEDSAMAVEFVTVGVPATGGFTVVTIVLVATVALAAPATLVAAIVVFAVAGRPFSVLVWEKGPAMLGGDVVIAVAVTLVVFIRVVERLERPAGGVLAAVAVVVVVAEMAVIFVSSGAEVEIFTPSAGVVVVILAVMLWIGSGIVAPRAVEVVVFEGPMIAGRVVMPDRIVVLGNLLVEVALVLVEDVFGGTKKV